MTAPIKWKIKDGDGDYIKYKEGDIVSKNGKIYAALRNTDVREGSPEHGEKAGWKPYTDNRIKKYTEDSSEPINPTKEMITIMVIMKKSLTIYQNLLKNRNLKNLAEEEKPKKF